MDFKLIQKKLVDAGKITHFTLANWTPACTLLYSLALDVHPTVDDTPQHLPVVVLCLWSAQLYVSLSYENVVEWVNLMRLEDGEIPIIYQIVHKDKPQKPITIPIGEITEAHYECAKHKPEAIFLRRLMIDCVCQNLEQAMQMFNIGGPFAQNNRGLFGFNVLHTNPSYVMTDITDLYTTEYNPLDLLITRPSGEEPSIVTEHPRVSWYIRNHSPIGKRRGIYIAEMFSSIGYGNYYEYLRPICQHWNCQLIKNKFIAI